jgi:uncharacterized C2H2 Zn-finger protein
MDANHDDGFQANRMIHFNTLSASLKCPYCGQSSAHRVKLAFGETRVMGRYQLGDRYPWRPGLPVERGGRPEEGDFQGDSTSRCPVCHQVFNVRIRIRNDIIRSIEPGRVHQNARPTRWLDGRVQARGHTPEPARSLLDEDLLSRGRAILERIRRGEMGERSSEICVLLYDFGETLRQKGQIQESGKAFYNAYLMAVALELTCWSSITAEAIRELARDFELSGADFEVELPAKVLLAGWIELLQDKAD